MTEQSETARKAPLWQRLGWFGGIWVASILALSLVAGAIKWAIKVPA